MTEGLPPTEAVDEATRGLDRMSTEDLVAALIAAQARISRRREKPRRLFLTRATWVADGEEFLIYPLSDTFGNRR